jgi:filamentous hemagglutinin
MNQKNYQLVFNAARGCIMAVSEATQRSCKGAGITAAQNVAGGGASGFSRSALLTLTLALSSLSAAMVQAQIIADPTAPGNQRPTVLGTPNGAPLVNIQTPSAAGVSRNTYQQFDVNAQGAVLNNSRTNVQTQLGGWVQANPWLATGEARIILNEVNSHNPSYLNGFIEVAGRRAEVIIANPAGIKVNGAGFINASRAILTTGTPVMNGGNLEAFRVQRGTISINGAGLNASLTDYTGILARAIEVNASIHAQQLNMAAGVNTLDAQQHEVQSGSAPTAQGATPSFALDVSELGGMYAGHIRLVGSEAGVGVRHHGTLAASVGDIHISTNGWLSSAGSIEARQGYVSVHTTGTQTHNGSLAAAGSLTLHAGTDAERQTLTQTGTARAGLEANIRASDLHNSGNIDAQRLDVAVVNLTNSGDIWQSGAQALDVQASVLDNQAGAALGPVVAPTSPSPPTQPEAGGGQAGGGAGGDADHNDGTSNPPANSGNDNTPAPQPPSTTLATGQVQVSGQLVQQDGATLAGAGLLHLHTTQALHNAGVLRAHTLQAQGQRFEHIAGTVEAQALHVQTQQTTLQSGSVWAQTVSVDTQTMALAQDAQLLGQTALDIQTHSLNNAGRVQSGADLQLAVAQSLRNSGVLAAASDVRVQSSNINNADGQIIAGRDLLAQVSVSLNNTGGTLSAQRQLALTDAATAPQPADLATRQLHINNTDGLIVANNAIAPHSSAVLIQAKSLNLDNGTLHSGGDMALDLVGSLHTQAGQAVRAGRNLAVQLHGAVAGTNSFVNAGQWQAGQDLTIRADHIDNQVTGEISSQRTTTLNTTQHASGSVTNRGVVDGADTHIQTHTLTNTGTGRIYGDRVAIAAHTLVNREETVAGLTKAGTIAARERLDIGAQHITNREGALLFSAGDMAIGGALDANQRAIADGSANAQTLNNNSATIESLGNMALATNVLRNTNEHFETDLFVTDGPRGLTLIQPSGSSARISTGLLRVYGFSNAWGYVFNTDPDPAQAAVAILGQTPVPGVGEETCSDWDDATTCSRVPGSDYLRDNPAWAYFGLTPPPLEPVVPALQQPQAPVLAQPIEPQAPDNTPPSSCEQGAPGFDATLCQAFQDGLAQAQTEYQAAMAQYQIDQQTYDNAWSQHQADQVAFDTAWAQYHASYEQWDDLTEDLYETLDQRITAYNRQFAGSLITHWTQYNITRTERQSQVTQSAPGQILAGGHLSLRGQDLLNDKSRIIVGQSLQGDLHHLESRQALGQNVVNETGTTQGSWTYTKRGGKLKTGSKRTHRDFSGHSPYNPPDVVTTITLNVAETRQNTAPTGSGTTLAALGQSGNTASAHAAQQLSNPGAALRASTAPSIVLPNSSLFTIHPASNARYLVETDPRFANYRQWLSSDYLLTASGFQPEAAQKRLGDGFYEQKLIREQVAALTGYRFLGDHRSDEAQYMALMTAGATFAQAHQLRPGIALSAAQVAQLTSDIVWLVAETVTLPDGSTTTALAPRVYLAPRQGDLAQNGQLFGGAANAGSLISARDIQLALSGDLHNSGTIAGRQLLDLSAQNIHNSGLLQGEVALLNAQDDIRIDGGQVAAHSGMALQAGGNITVETTIQSGTTQAGRNTFSQQGIDRVAGLYVSGPAGVLLASAGNDINLIAAQVHNAGSGATQLQAGGNVNLGAVQTGQSHDITWSANHYHRQSSSTDVGTQITGGGAVTIQAQNDINARAAQVNAQGALNLNAGGNVTIEAGQSSQSLAESQQSTSRGTLSRSTTTRASSSQSTTAQASELGGQSVTIASGADTRIVGSNVLADQDLNIQAGGNLSIEAAQNTYSSSQFHETKKSGVFGSGGIGITVGSQQQSTDAQNQRTTAAASTVGAIDGNVNLNAGQTYTQTGSDVLAPGGDVNISAQRVNIEEARETSRQSVEQRARQSGLTVAITSPVISAMQTIHQQIEAAGNTQSGRMQALAAANVAFNAQQAANAIQAGQGQVPTGNKLPDGSRERVDGNAADKAGGIGISVSLGSSRSQSNQSSSTNTARGSSVTAGGDVNITASGGGANSDITIQGSTVQAGGTTRLSAEDEVRQLAAANTSTQSSSQSSKTGSIGVGINLGAGGTNMGVTASASRGTGQGAGSGTTYTHTQVSSDTVQIESGGDTTLKGAVVKADQVTATIGGNLLIETLQDSNRYNESSKSAGGSVTIGPAPGGSLNLAQTRINSTYQSATEQSGIRAGDGGFQVNVAGNTTLTGGVITSSEQAVQDGNNQFTTAGQTAQEALQSGALTLTDLQNHASYSARSTSVGLGAGAAQPGQSPSAALSGVGLGRDSSSASSTTQAGISGLAGNAQARTSDAPTGIGPIFDVDKVRREIAAQVQITQEFNKQAGRVIDSYIETQRAALQERVKNATTPDEQAQAQQALKDVNMQERALNILVGALTGMGGTMVTKEALSTAAEKMRDLMIEDSRTFAGVVDSTGQTLDNISGESVGVRGDGLKLGGTRVDLDGLCGPGNERCLINDDGSLALNQNNEIEFTAKDSAGNRLTIEQFLRTPEGKKLIGPTGGVQGLVGTMFGIPYVAGSWVDRLVEAFAGPHDFIGGGISGLYDELGNAKRGMSEVEKKAFNTWSAVAIPVAAPFAAADGVSREVWQAISILLRAAR